MEQLCSEFSYDYNINMQQEVGMNGAPDGAIIEIRSANGLVNFPLS